MRASINQSEKWKHLAAESKESKLDLSIRLTLIAKILIFFFVLKFGTPINKHNYDRYETHWPSNGEPIWMSRLACADSADYLSLANSGYQSGSRLCAFYPLWPFLLRITGVSKAPIAPVGSALLAIIFWAIGLSLLHQWVEQVSNSSLAQAVTLAHLALPSSIFFWLGYTESLFFLLTVLFISTSESDHWWPSVLAAILLPLTRPVGVFVVLVPALRLFADGNHNRWRSLVQFTAGIAGFCFYLTILWFFTGNPWEGFEAQDFYVNRPSLSHLLEPTEFARRLIQVDGWHTPTGSVLDRLTFVWCAALLIPMWRIKPIWFFWAVPMFLIPAFTNWFLSLSRFSIVIVPMTLSLGVWMYQCDRWLFRTFMVFGMANQAFLLNRHCAFGWGS